MQILLNQLKIKNPIIKIGFDTKPKNLSVEPHIWVTARGIEIPVPSMSTLHINNCIACWEGRGNMEIPKDYLGGKQKWLEILNQELIKRQ